MSHDPPNFEEFTHWVARTCRDLESGAQEAASQATSVGAARYDKLLTAARVARDESRGAATALPRLAVLRVLAAADKGASSALPELTTARGFRVTLAYDEGGGAETSSICVLVRCPPELVSLVQGESAYLWNGEARFELGQFDSEGKAIGTLPAGIEISQSDFAMGKVKLEEPGPSRAR